MQAIQILYGKDDFSSVLYFCNRSEGTDKNLTLKHSHVQCTQIK
jgi:hypothetical protein